MSLIVGVSIHVLLKKNTSFHNPAIDNSVALWYNYSIDESIVQLVRNDHSWLHVARPHAAFFGLLALVQTPDAIPGGLFFLRGLG